MVWRHFLFKKSAADYNFAKKRKMWQKFRIVPLPWTVYSTSHLRWEHHSTLLLEQNERKNLPFTTLARRSSSTKCKKHLFNTLVNVTKPNVISSAPHKCSKSTSLIDFKLSLGHFSWTPNRKREGDALFNVNLENLEEHLGIWKLWHSLSNCHATLILR